MPLLLSIRVTDKLSSIHFVLFCFFVFFFPVLSRRAMNDSFVRKFHRFLPFICHWLYRFASTVGRQVAIVCLSHYYPPTIRNALIPCLYWRDKCCQRNNIAYIVRYHSEWYIFELKRLEIRTAPPAKVLATSFNYSGESCGTLSNIFLPQQLYTPRQYKKIWSNGKAEKKREKDMEQWKS